MWLKARHFRKQIFHLERIHVLYDTRNLQRATFVLRKADEEDYFLSEIPDWETKGGI